MARRRERMTARKAALILAGTTVLIGAMVYVRHNTETVMQAIASFVNSILQR